MTKEEQQSIKWVERFGISLFNGELSLERRHLNRQLEDRSYLIYNPIKKTWVVWFISTAGSRRKSGKWFHDGVAEAVLWLFSASAEFERERLKNKVENLSQSCELVAL